MSTIARLLALICGIVGGLVASQAPEFAQQYRQRLGGAIDELRRVVQRFDSDAGRTGQARAAALRKLQDDPDELVRRQGNAMEANMARLNILEQQRSALTEAGPFERVFVLLKDFDPEITRAAYRDFEPAVPATEEGVATAVGGAAIGWGLAFVLLRSMGRLFRRRPAERGGVVRTRSA